MANSNKIITSPVRQDADVRTVLGETTHTLSGLCTSPKINVWAKKKPVRRETLNRNIDWWKADAQNCGIAIQKYTDLVALVNVWLDKPNLDWRDFWQHEPPTGGTYPYRLLDFNGYKHTATNPDEDKPYMNYSVKPQVTRYLQDGVESFDGVQPNLTKRTTNDTYLLQLSDMRVPDGGGFLDLDNTFFGIAIVKEGTSREYAFVTTYYKFNENPYKVGGVYMDNSQGKTYRVIPDLTKYSLPKNGSYYVFPFLSSARLWDNGIYEGSNISSNPILMQHRDSFAGIFVPLPFYGQMINVVDREPDIKLTLQAYQTMDDMIRLNIEATNVRNTQVTLNKSYLTYHYVEIQNDTQGNPDYPGYELEGVWGTEIENIPANSSIYFYRDFDTRHRTIEMNLYGGYICDIYVTSSWNYIQTPVSAPNFDWIKDTSEIEFSAFDDEMEVEETSTWSVNTTPSSGMTLQWSSSDTSIATVSGSGKTATVTAVSVGTAWIRCEATNYTAWDDQWVDVVPKSGGGGGSTIHITEIQLKPDEKTIKVNEKFTFSITYTPSNATNKTIRRWWSDDPSIASVNASTGQVTGKSIGYTWIYAETADGGKTDRAKIIVNPNNTGTAVTSVSLNYDSIELVVGDTFDALEATVYPTSATNKNVTWSNTSRVQLITDGAKRKVKALSAGTATVTVTTQDGGKTATCNVTIYSSGGSGKINVTGIALNPTSAIAHVGKQDVSITATVSPPNATNKTVVWQSSNTNVARVDSSGKVTGVGVGQCQIAARATNGTSSTSDDKTAVCYITVEQLVTKITLNKYSLKLTIGGQYPSETLVATITPSNATKKELRWWSTYPEIASVQTGGLVVAHSVGVCNIWVEATDGGGAFNICDVEVYEDGTPNPMIPITGVDIMDSQNIVRTGQIIAMNRTSHRTEQLHELLAPTSATNVSLGWSSRNEGVATVSITGLVTVVAAGDAIIDLAANGDYSSFATASVTIRVS